MLYPRFVSPLRVGLLAVLLLPGCAYLEGRTVARPFEMTSQPAVRSVQHWNLIADDIASRMNILRDNPRIAARSIFVDYEGKSSFSKAFRNMLESRLGNRGFTMSSSKEGAVVIRFETQLVRHAARPTEIPRGGELALLGGGLVVMRALAAGDLSLVAATNASAALLTASDAALVYKRLAEPSQNELVVTTRMTDNNSILLGWTDVYYIDDQDHRLYDPPPPKAPLLLPARQIGVVSE